MPMTSDQAFVVGLVQVPEGRQLFDRMSVQDNLLMGAFKRDDKAAVARIWRKCMRFFRVCRSVGVRSQEACRAANSKCAPWLVALMAVPVLLMIDEMSLGLAPVIVEQLMDVLAAIRDEGVTVLLVEQDVNLALSIANRAYVMETGRIVRGGSARELIDDPEVRRAYLGL